jgi:hypothetical protein
MPGIVLASEPMKIRATFLGLAKLAAATAVTGGLASCAGTHGKMVVDSPALTYQAPDISDITGIDEDSDSDSAAGSASGSAAAK